MDNFPPLISISPVKVYRIKSSTMRKAIQEEPGMAGMYALLIEGGVVKEIPWWNFWTKETK
jgi:hypothetical protein